MKFQIVLDKLCIIVSWNPQSCNPCNPGSPTILILTDNLSQENAHKCDIYKGQPRTDTSSHRQPQAATKSVLTIGSSSVSIESIPSIDSFKILITDLLLLGLLPLFSSCSLFLTSGPVGQQAAFLWDSNSFHAHLWYVLSNFFP